MTCQIILASGNKGKLSELQALLEKTNINLIRQGDLDIETPAETGKTFVENAILKARYACEQSGMPAIADDSGLEVDALQGRPGIYSARYAGLNATDENNVEKLITELSNTPDAERSARFQCVIVYLSHAADPTPIICQGTWEGSILSQPQGANGFGYDPVFYVPTHHCSSAELTPEIKNHISHRGQALTQLLDALSSIY